jgi:iron(III) transport system ATP-binding protein
VVSSPLLQLTGLTHRYGDRTVVSEASFALPAGRIACLLGPSGCGKTTLLRLIAGFERPAAGSIALDGAVISSTDAVLTPERRHMGMVFQDFALFPHLTVAGNIGFGLAKTARTQRIAELLELTGLAGLGERFPHQLSGGQQQRVALARALAPRPRLVLLDEPFSSLDVDLRERLAAEVRQILLQEGTTAILVTHDQHEAFAFADEIGVVHDGRIEQWASAYDLYHRPATRFVADFIGEGTFLRGRRTPAGIDSELGLLTGEIRCPPSTPADADVDILLRPDDVIHDDAAPCKAVVTAKAFRGAEILYSLRLASGATVAALVPSHHDHAIGAPIGIRLDAAHVIAFPA